MQPFLFISFFLNLSAADHPALIARYQEFLETFTQKLHFFSAGI
jgi:hypothetical protein